MSYLSRDPEEVKSTWVSEMRTFQIHAKFWDGLSQDDQNRLIKRERGTLWAMMETLGFTLSRMGASEEF